MIDAVHSITRSGIGSFTCDVTIFGERVIYGVSVDSGDVAPVHAELVRLIESGAVPVQDAQPDIPTAAAVDRERNRRLSSMNFQGHVYDFDTESRRRISANKVNAQVAIIGGSQQGDLRWADPDRDFAWIAADNAAVPMDAQAMLDFGIAADRWEARHIMAGRAIKAINPIPADYADDSRWPA